MQQDYTHVSILLDRSGSMQEKAADVLGGLNQLLDEQRKVPGKLTISLAMFDNEYTSLAHMKPVKEHFDLSGYKPRGGTALRDSFHRLMVETGAALAALPEEARPSKVLIVVFTDGEENQSREISAPVLKDYVEQQRSKYAWEFMFIGADMDALTQGANMGVRGVSVRGQNLGGAVSYTSAYIGSSRTGDASLQAKLLRVAKVEDADAQAAVLQWQAAVKTNQNPDS